MEHTMCVLMEAVSQERAEMENMDQILYDEGWALQLQVFVLLFIFEKEK